MTDLFDFVAQSGANPCEKIPTLVRATAAEAARDVAHEIARLVRSREAEGRRAVLGLATGSTPIAVYRELVRLHREEGLSFRHVTTFNLDEYYPCRPTEAHSYRRFMQENLFDHIDIDPRQTHVPAGDLPREAVPTHCAEYEASIREAGGLDLQLLGIGRTGHIAFNEPGASGASRTRLVTLHATTLADNRALATGVRLPVQALTLGVGTILEARRVVLLALGEHKRAIVRAAIEGPITTEVTASFLQNHPAAVVVLDEAAAGDLTRVHAPWLLGPLDLQGRVWDEALVRQAVIWLALEAAKPILKLEDTDYTRHGLEELLAHGGSAYALNLQVFRRLQGTVSGWPAGRPRAGQDTPEPRRILVCSPHPDDDVISFGGTLARLCAQGHEVHVAYQVSGANAVSAEFLERQLDFVREGKAPLGFSGEVPRLEALDPASRRVLAAAVRRAEARSAAGVAGVPAHRCHFLDLPFYERPGRRTDPEDVERIRALLGTLRPQQIYAAGDLADPHGTHRICLELLAEAWQAERAAGQAWAESCEGWLYRGAWGDWRAHEIDLAIPLSPAEVLLKRRAILRHQSQKDETPFLGNDVREFWQRAEDRTREAAELYRRLGWAEYAALETLARWPGH
jgi:glucosamine-6-phosphate deaminase